MLADVFDRSKVCAHTSSKIKEYKQPKIIKLKIYNSNVKPPKTVHKKTIASSVVVPSVRFSEKGRKRIYFSVYLPIYITNFEPDFTEGTSTKDPTDSVSA